MKCGPQGAEDGSGILSDGPECAGEEVRNREISCNTKDAGRQCLPSGCQLPRDKFLFLRRGFSVMCDFVYCIVDE